MHPQQTSQKSLDTIRDLVAQTLSKWREGRQPNMFRLLQDPNRLPITLDGVDLSGMDFSPVRYVRYTGIDEDGETYTVHGEFYLVVDRNIRMNHANWTDSKLNQSRFKHVIMQYALLVNTVARGVKWLNVNAMGSQLDGARFESYCHLPDCDFSSSQANTTPAKFSSCTATGIKFNGAKLPKADFSHTKMPRCQYQHATITDADFSYTNCRGGNFRYAIVGAMNVTRGNFSHADFTGVDLSQVIGFNIKYFKGAKLENAKLPDNAVYHRSCMYRCLLFFQSTSLPHASLPDRKDLSLILIKPEGLRYTTKILSTIQQNEIRMMAIKRIKLTKKQILHLYRALKRYYFFQALVDYMTGRTAFAIAVTAQPGQLAACKDCLRHLYAQELGTQPLDELEEEANLILTDATTDQKIYQDQYARTFDIIHCSDPSDRQREIKIFFNQKALKQKKMSIHQRMNAISQLLKENHRHVIDTPRPKPILNHEAQNWLMIIKPEGMHFLDVIFQTISTKKLSIFGAKSVIASQHQIEKLYKKYKEAYFYTALMDYVTGGNIIVLAVNGTATQIASCRTTLRTELTEKIIERASSELNEYRAQQATEDFLIEYQRTYESIHCSDEGDGDHEIGLFFNPKELHQTISVSANEKILIMRRLLDHRKAAQGLVFERPALFFEQVLTRSNKHITPI